MVSREALSTLTMVSLLGISCGGEIDPILPAPRVSAHVAALSTYDASVGTLIEAYGENFPSTRDADIQLVFRGTFLAHDGSSEQVELITPVHRVDSGTVRWTAFGPFRNPFSVHGNKIGRFEGTVGARLLYSDRERTVVDDPEPIDIQLTVGPSLFVQELQPLSASCQGAVKRALGGASYRVKVEAVGFDPASFTYTLSAPALEKTVAVRHIATGRYDSVGDRGDFTLPPVPDSLRSYGAILSIDARDVEGRSRQSLFAFQVHRPLEVFYNGNIEIAEVLAPAPVSGCMPGGETGRRVQYSESNSETRSRNYEVNWNESWLASHTVSQGSEQTVGLSETNGVGFATTDGQSFNWSLGGEVSGGFTLFKLVEVGLKASMSMGGETSRQVQNSAERTTGVNASTTTTETEEVSRQQSSQIGANFAWEVSSTDSIARGFDGLILPNTYGVFYRQSLRLLRRGALVAYNQCGSATVVADLDFFDWAWSPDLGLGDQCPPLPKSNLPDAQCLIPPCTGQ